MNLSDKNGNDAELLIGGPYGEHRYGHVALRVFGETYDVTYDFGRYGDTWGVGGSEGDGMLRVWSDFNQYIAGENSIGRTTTGFVYESTESQDKDAIAYFGRMIDSAQRTRNDPRGRSFVEYKTDSDYHALENNCTTICLAGMAASNQVLASLLDNPEYNDGRGLNFSENTLAALSGGFNAGIFMPEDLKASAESLNRQIRIEIFPRH